MRRKWERIEGKGQSALDQLTQDVQVWRILSPDMLRIEQEKAALRRKVSHHLWWYIEERMSRKESPYEIVTGELDFSESEEERITRLALADVALTRAHNLAAGNRIKVGGYRADITVTGPGVRYDNHSGNAGVLHVAHGEELEEGETVAGVIADFTTLPQVGGRLTFRRWYGGVSTLSGLVDPMQGCQNVELEISRRALEPYPQHN